MPHELTRRMPRRGLTDWTGQGGQGFFPGQEVPRDDTIYDIDLKGFETERVWRDLLAGCSPAQSAMRQRRSLIVKAGFAVEAGRGDRADLYARFARMLWANLYDRGQLIRDLEAAEVTGWAPFSVQPWIEQRFRSPVSLEGHGLVLLPRFIRAHDPWEFHFDVSRNLIIPEQQLSRRGAGDLVVRTSPDGFLNPDQAGFWTPTRGDSDSPYGEALLRSQYTMMTIWRRFLESMAEGMDWSTGRGQVKLKKDQKISDVQVDLNQAKLFFSHNRIQILTDDMESWDQKTVPAFQESWGKALGDAGRSIISAILGSHLSVEQPDQGARAASDTHQDSALASAMEGGDLYAEQITTGLLVPWMALNHIFPTPEEMPRFVSKLGRTISLEKLQLFVTLVSSPGTEGIDLREVAEAHHVPLKDPETYDPEPAQPVAPVVVAPAEEDEEEPEEDQDEGEEAEDEEAE